MKLFYSPGACSLSDHIALHEVAADFEHEKVDLKSKMTESGGDYTIINPKGYVPALVLDTGETLTENVAILDWIAQKYGKLMPAGPMGRTKQLAALAYITAEIHKAFKPFFAGASDNEKAKAGETIVKRLQYFVGTMEGDFLFGAELSAADCYLFVMLLWCQKNGVEVPNRLNAFRDRMLERASVKKAMGHEGLG